MNNQPTTLWINIYNAQGQIVQSTQEQIKAGKYQRKLSVPNISGTYWVQLTTSNGELRQLKLLKL